MDDMMSATVMIKTDFPRNKRSLQIAAAKWFLPVPGFSEKIKLAMFPQILVMLPLTDLVYDGFF